MKEKDFNVEKGNFTIVNNEIFTHEIDNKRLSPEAIGIYCFMISLPDSWDYTINGLSAVVNAGSKKVARILTELESHGFLLREQKIENGRFSSMKYTVFQKPITNDKNVPLGANRLASKSLASNGVQVSTKEVSTNKEIDKLMIKGENPRFQHHFLTNELISKKVISVLDYDLEKYNNLFAELDNKYNYNLVLQATRYLVPKIKSNKNLSSKYNYFESAILTNLQNLSSKLEHDSKPQNYQDFMNELKQENNFTTWISQDNE